MVLHTPYHVPCLRYLALPFKALSLGKSCTQSAGHRLVAVSRLSAQPNRPPFPLIDCAVLCRSLHLQLRENQRANSSTLKQEPPLLALSDFFMLACSLLHPAHHFSRHHQHPHHIFCQKRVARRLVKFGSRSIKSVGNPCPTISPKSHDTTASPKKTSLVFGINVSFDRPSTSHSERGCFRCKTRRGVICTA